MLVLQELKKNGTGMACSEKCFEKVEEGKMCSVGKSAKWPELAADILKCVCGHRKNSIAVTIK
jgi:hypothetical protein